MTISSLSDILNKFTLRSSIGSIANSIIWHAIVFIFLVIISFEALFSIRQYAVTFGLRPRTINDTEINKFLASGHPAVHLAATIAAIDQKNTNVLTFRIAETAFYGKRNFVSYLDQRLAPLYQSKSIDAAASILRSMNIGFILLPPYALPEVYGTIMEGVLASPAHVNLLADLNGWRLFELQAQKTNFHGQVIYSTDFRSRPTAMQEWGVFKGSKTADMQGGWLSAHPSKDWFATRDPRLRLFRDGAGYQEDFNTLRDDALTILKPGSVSIFTARLRGLGLIRAVMELPTKRGGISRLTLWEGVLDGREREIAAQFITPLNALDATTTETASAIGRLVFETVAEAHLSLGGWSFTEVAPRSRLASPAIPAARLWQTKRLHTASIVEPPVLPPPPSPPEPLLIHAGNFGTYPTILLGPLLKPLSLGAATNRLRVDIEATGKGVASLQFETSCIGEEKPRTTVISRVLLTENSLPKHIVGASPCAFSGIRPIVALDAQHRSLRDSGSATTIQLKHFDVAIEALNRDGVIEWIPLQLSTETTPRF